MRTELGIATSTTNLYPKQAVLLIGFILEESEIADKVRKLVVSNDDIFEITPEQEEYAYQMYEPPVVVEPTVQKQYNDVLKDIRRIIEHLGEGKSSSISNYFIESSYVDGANRQKPCYQLTKKGCELFATRMTGASNR